MSAFGILQDSSSSANGEDKEPKLQELDEEFIDSVISACPRLSTLITSGFSVNPTCLSRLVSKSRPTPWTASLSVLEFSLQGLRQLSAQSYKDVQALLRTHVHLKTFELCIERVPTLPEEIHDTPWTHFENLPGVQDLIIEIHGDGSVARPAERGDEAALREKLMGRLCRGVEGVLKGVGWWVERVRIVTPMMKSQRIRALLLNRFNE
jgi:hypothetical protein